MLAWVSRTIVADGAGLPEHGGNDRGFSLTCETHSKQHSLQKGKQKTLIL